MGTTAVLPITSDLKRKAWIREGLIQAASKSFWMPFTGGSMSSVIYQENDISAGAGHTVVFDFEGNIKGKAIKGKNTAFGRGEQKRQFSDKITVDRYRLVVDNGDKFDGVDVGNLNITEHADSRSKLGDLWIRFKDQMIFDAMQGNLGQAPSHVIDLGTSFTFGNVLDIEKVIKTSNGFSTGSTRRPLDAYTMKDGRKVWLFIIDAAMENLLRKDTSGFQTIMAQSDVRGEDNRNIKGVLGRIGQLLIVSAEQFFGSTTGTATNWGLDASEIEISGLRQYSGADPTTSAWTGQSSFNYSSTTLHSRGVILGNAAVQLAMGKMPDYKIQASQDFAISSESALEFWTAVRKTNMTAENDDYTAAKVAGLDFGCIAVDVEVQ
jgi:hypothetical protein